MAKKLTIAEQNNFLIELHTRPKGMTKWAICRRFDISAQRGHHINNHHLSDPKLSNQLSQLRNQLLDEFHSGSDRAGLTAVAITDLITKQVGSGEEISIVEAISKELIAQIGDGRADSLSQAIATEIDNQLRELQELPAPRPEPISSKNRDIFLAKAITSEMMAQKKQTQKKAIKFAISISLAAVLVFAVTWFTGNQTQANELKQMQSALKKVQWVHIEFQSGLWAGTKHWRRFEPQVFASTKSDGSAVFVSEAAGQGWRLRDGKMIGIEDWRSALRTERSVYEFLDNQLGLRISQSRATSIEKVELNGEPSQLITIVAKGKTLKIWCDPVTHLPQKIQDKTTDFLLSFPYIGPQSIKDIL